jgi:hypothetical protein
MALHDKVNTKVITAIGRQRKRKGQGPQSLLRT